MSASEIYPTDDAQAIGSMKPGDVAIIFTPDDTHFAIASAAITAGLHVLVAKPIVKNLQEHKQLVALAKRHNVLVRA
jgi:D-galacturonate reductase